MAVQYLPKRSPKSQKIFEESKNRISHLPNRVICHILSFLPTKYVVVTWVLSTKWTNLWALVPNLDFDDELINFVLFWECFYHRHLQICYIVWDNFMLLVKFPHFWLPTNILKIIAHANLKMCSNEGIHHGWLCSEPDNCYWLIVD